MHIKVNKIKKIFISLMMMAGILFCSLYSLSTASTASCETSAPTNSHSDMATQPVCGEHEENGHSFLNYLPTLTIFTTLFIIIIAVVILFRKHLLMLTEQISVALRYYLHRHRVRVKSTLERAYLRWLSYLGGTVAFSF